ncbi:hypothetical protein SCG7109_AR_00050 [Chlamydiales bacterium SCGC AG-110-M15]|nr:hypothetical protein SCG7109_AR_00050 [Chlamydiales bacterium SCGC AG-110-M15]
MADIISLKSLHYFDYDSAVDEVEVLVPKYLDVLGLLERSDSFYDISIHLKSVVSYWTRIAFLLEQIQTLEQDESLDVAMKTSLQSELEVLEKVYLKINEVIQFFPNRWTDEMWLAADQCIQRMDNILSIMGFTQDHEDRALLRDVMHKNHIKSRQTAYDKVMEIGPQQA